MAILPSGYTQLEYIESTGTQYIDTGIIPSMDLEIFLDFQPSVLPSTNVVYIGAVGQYTLRYNSGFRHNTGGNVQSFPTTITVLSRHNAYKFGNTANIDGIKAPNTSATTPSFSSNLFLFGYNNSGIAQNFSMMRVYSLRLIENNTLLRNFIPCYNNNNNEIGMYDTISGSFYSNSGTGNFIAGPILMSNQIFVKVNNTWKTISNIYTKTNNTW